MGYCIDKNNKTNKTNTLFESYTETIKRQNIHKNIFNERIEYAKFVINAIKNINIVQDIRYTDIIQIDDVRILNINGNIVEDNRIHNCIELDIVIKIKMNLKTLTYHINFNNEKELFNVIQEIKLYSSCNEISLSGLSNRYQVVFTNGSFGVFIHEVLGHLMEADNYIQYDVLRNMNKTSISINELTVIDTYEKKGVTNNNIFDDEGNLISVKTLIKSGKISDVLSTNEYKNLYGTGNARRESYKNRALPRMNDTIVLPGKSQYNDIINNVQNGLMIKSCLAGSVDYTKGDVTLFSNNCFLIKDGKITDSINNATIKSTSLELLSNINMIGNDLTRIAGNCNKLKQNVYITATTPTTLVNNLIVE